MATIPKTGIVNGQPILSPQITSIIDALDGTTNNEIDILGTLSLPNIADVSASIAAISSSGGGGSPGGANQQVQFNDNGVFGTDANFKYNTSVNGLTVGKIYSAGSVQTFLDLTSTGLVAYGSTLQLRPTGLLTLIGSGVAIGATATTSFINMNCGGSTSISSNIQITMESPIITIGDTSTTTYNVLFGTNISIGDTNTTNTTIGGTTVNVGASSTLTQLGAANQRIKLGTANTTTGVITEGNTYVIKNGASAFNIGTSTSTSDNENSRFRFDCTTQSTKIYMRGTRTDGGETSQTEMQLSNYGSNSLLSSDVGEGFFLTNDFSQASYIGFGSTTTSTVKMRLYVANNTSNARPTATTGGLIIDDTLELTSTSAYKSSGTTWTTTSDSRLKENITTASLDICYDNIKNLPLKRFNYVDKYSKNPIGDRTQLGWIAQDVNNTLPKAVVSSSFTTWVDYSGETITGSNDTLITSGSRVQDVLAGSEVIDDILTLDSDQIIKMMYGAIQKLQAKVETLENQ